jgi:hypothetical protein
MIVILKFLLVIIYSVGALSVSYFAKCMVYLLYMVIVILKKIISYNLLVYDSIFYPMYNFSTLLLIIHYLIFIGLLFLMRKFVIFERKK